MAESQNKLAFSEANLKPAEEPKRTRETWTNKIDFLFALVGFSVGLGNVWRFPYLCYKNGGGAFLIPYFICVVIGGIPFFYLEVAMGQFMSRGGVESWNLCPLFKGVGVASAIVVFFLNCYYNVIIAWTLYYLFASFTSTLPWSTCDNEWNRNCSLTWFNNTDNTTLQVDPTTEFWENKVLGLSDGIENIGTPKWDLTLCLLLGWILVFFCIWKGVKSSGKVMYFTAPAPYIFMTILMVRAATLPGAYNGVMYYLKPDLSKLTDIKVWVDAGTQIFFSYSIGLGTMQALGSFNKFKHNSLRDSIIFAAVNSGTSFYAGFVIFMTLGYMAHTQNIEDVGKVAGSGPGLAFIAYPKALAAMPWAPPFWAALFFFMVLLLGLDSQFVGVEGFVTAITDLFPKTLGPGRRREAFIAFVCIISFGIGLSMVSNGGMYVFQLFDYYSGSKIILIVAFFECIVIAYFYGANRFSDNLKMMYGFNAGIVLKWFWMFISPAFCLGVFILSIIAYGNTLTYTLSSTGFEYHYPAWAVAIGWTTAGVSIIMIPIMMVVYICKETGPIGERIKNLLRPRLHQHQLRPQDDPRELCPDSEGEEEGGPGAYCYDSPSFKYTESNTNF